MWENGFGGSRLAKWPDFNAARLRTSLACDLNGPARRSQYRILQGDVTFKYRGYSLAIVYIINSCRILDPFNILNLLYRTEYTELEP